MLILFKHGQFHCHLSTILRENILKMEKIMKKVSAPMKPKNACAQQVKLKVINILKEIQLGHKHVNSHVLLYPVFRYSLDLFTVEYMVIAYGIALYHCMPHINTNECINIFNIVTYHC